MIWTLHSNKMLHLKKKIKYYTEKRQQRTVDIWCGPCGNNNSQTSAIFAHFSCTHSSRVIHQIGHAMEKCAFPAWLSVVTGRCWLLLGEINSKKTKNCCTTNLLVIWLLAKDAYKQLPAWKCVTRVYGLIHLVPHVTMTFTSSIYHHLD